MLETGGRGRGTFDQLRGHLSRCTGFATAQGTGYGHVALRAGGESLHVLRPSAGAAYRTDVALAHMSYLLPPGSLGSPTRKITRERVRVVWLRPITRDYDAATSSNAGGTNGSRQGRMACAWPVCGTGPGCGIVEYLRRFVGAVGAICWAGALVRPHEYYRARIPFVGQAGCRSEGRVWCPCITFKKGCGMPGTRRNALQPS